MALTDVAELQLRNSIRLATPLALVGIGMSVSLSESFGGVLTVAAVLWLVLSLHRFGRLGAA